jgi:hypothetical protein
MGSIAKSTNQGTATNIAQSAVNHHKKSNSMVNAKMAQIILKGPSTGQS